MTDRTLSDSDDVGAPAVASRRVWPDRVVRGVLLGSVLAVILSVWFFGQAEREISQDYYERQVVTSAMGLAEIVADAERQELPAESLAEIVSAWTVGEPGAEGVRVLRLSGASLRASTEQGDAAEKSLPRRLARNEKWFYDLAQEIRTAVETNRDEGVFRKAHVDVERLGTTEYRVTLPYFVDDSVSGVVQVRRSVTTVPRGSMAIAATLAIALPTLAMLALGWLVPVLRAPGGSRWGQALAAIAVFSVGFYFFGQYGLDRAGTLELELNQSLAAEYQSLRDSARVLASDAGVNLIETTDNLWDVDDYQRPLALVRGSGELDSEAAERQVEARRGFLGNAMRGNWVSGLVLLLFIGLGYGQRVWRTVVEHRDAYLYVTPAMLGMLLLVMFPFAYGVALSFTDMTLFNENLPLRDLWVGLKNYVDILGDFNVAKRTEEGWIFNYKNFYWTLYITICWTVFNVLIGVSIGLVLALALNTKGLRGKSIYRILLILPWAVPNYITALTWRGMFHQQFGVINQAIQMFGGEPVAWFDGVFPSFITGLATNGWLSFPFMMVVILGGLQSISADMYEAARVEGATRWQQFRHITLPLLKPTLIPAIIISVVWTFNMFNIIFLVSGGEPGGANEILITQAYKLAFEQYRYAYAAAYSVVIFLILLTYGVFQNKMSKATENVA